MWSFEGRVDLCLRVHQRSSFDDYSALGIGLLQLRFQSVTHCVPGLSLSFCDFTVVEKTRINYYYRANSTVALLSSGMLMMSL